MTKFDKKAILSAKDSVKSASDKLTKIAMDMDSTESAPSPEQVKEVVESIAAVAQEIVQQADMVATGLDEVTSDTTDDVETDTETNVVSGMSDEEKQKMAALEEETEELKKFKETSDKEKMASTYANLFQPKERTAKFNEFMKMDKPNSELRTVLSATENVLTSLSKSASMPRKETIIFQESNQKNASMGFGPNQAKTLGEI